MTRESGFPEHQDPAAVADGAMAAYPCFDGTLSPDALPPEAQLAMPTTTPAEVAAVARQFAARLPEGPSALDRIRAFTLGLPEKPSRLDNVVYGLRCLIGRVIRPGAAHLQRTAAETPSTAKYGFVFDDWVNRKPDQKS